MREEAYMSMTSMFLQKLVDSGMIEHRKMTRATEESWKHMCYRNKNTGEVAVLHKPTLSDMTRWEHI